MIVEYHRPQNLEQALALLGRQDVRTVPLGGGSAMERRAAGPFAVVDLQALGLDRVSKRGNTITLGATRTLQVLSETAELPHSLRQVVLQEGNHNLRQVATLAGTLVAADGRSPLAAALLALDARLALQPGDESLPLGELLPLRFGKLAGKLITQLSFSLNTRLAYQAVKRTPADWPVVCAALAQWPGGRTRLVLGGWGASPRVVFDGPETAGLEAAAQQACSFAADAWASAEYRQEMAMLLAKRCLAEVAAAG